MGDSGNNQVNKQMLGTIKCLEEEEIRVNMQLVWTDASYFEEGHQSETSLLLHGI